MKIYLRKFLEIYRGGEPRLSEEKWFGFMPAGPVVCDLLRPKSSTSPALCHVFFVVKLRTFVYIYVSCHFCSVVIVNAKKDW